MNWGPGAGNNEFKAQVHMPAVKKSTSTAG